MNSVVVVVSAVSDVSAVSAVFDVLPLVVETLKMYLYNLCKEEENK